jgi:hypothetical protein
MGIVNVATTAAPQKRKKRRCAEEIAAAISPAGKIVPVREPPSRVSSRGGSAESSHRRVGDELLQMLHVVGLAEWRQRFAEEELTIEVLASWDMREFRTIFPEGTIPAGRASRLLDLVKAAWQVIASGINEGQVCPAAASARKGDNSQETFPNVGANPMDAYSYLFNPNSGCVHRQIVGGGLACQKARPRIDLAKLVSIDQRLFQENPTLYSYCTPVCFCRPGVLSNTDAPVTPCK